VLTYITSNKWMRAGYGKKLRDYFTETTQPKILIDCGADMFKSATVDTNILLFEKKLPQNQHIKAITLKNKEQAKNLSQFKMEDFTQMPLPKNGESWVVLSPIEQRIKEKIERIGTPLKDWDINIYRGVLTGYNEAFIIDGNKKDELIAKDPRSAEIIPRISLNRYQQKHEKNTFAFIGRSQYTDFIWPRKF